MSRLFYHVMQDNSGNLLFDVSGTMRIAGSGTLATIYGDEALTVILPNPMTNHPSFASFKCFLPSGDFDFYMSKSGYTFETLTGVQGHGSMAQQDATAVAITGGSATGLVTVGAQKVGVGILPPANHRVSVLYLKNSEYGIAIQPADTDAGTALTMVFVSQGGAIVGSINSTGSATAFNTSSDVRLKEDVQPLTDALAVVQQLRPVAFRWKGDGSPGQGFLANEVQAVVPEAVTGTPGAVDAAGQIVPMQLDMSKLVPWLVAGMQALTTRVAALEARLA